MASSTSFWLKFFRDAGIQTGIDKKYASIFEENRIKADMMMDLDKGLLKEMEITAIGDILAILKHAKRVNEQNKEEAVEIHRPVSSSTTPDSANVTKSVVHPVQSTVVAVSQRAQEVKKVDSTASGLQQEVIRIGLRKTVSTATAATPKELGGNKIVVLNKRSITEQSLKEEVPVQKKIRVLPEHEGKYKIKMPEGSIPRTQKALQSRRPKDTVIVATTSTGIKRTVFSRLGDSVVTSTSQTTTVESAVTSEAKKSSIFSRLGGKSSDSSQTSSLVSQPSTSKAAKVDPRVYAEKTLKTIPSKISIHASTSSGVSTARMPSVSQVSSTVSSSFRPRKVVVRRRSLEEVPVVKSLVSMPSSVPKDKSFESEEVSESDKREFSFVRTVVAKKTSASAVPSTSNTLPSLLDLDLRDQKVIDLPSPAKKKEEPENSTHVRDPDRRRRHRQSQSPSPVISSVIKVVSGGNTVKKHGFRSEKVEMKMEQSHSSKTYCKRDSISRSPKIKESFAEKSKCPRGRSSPKGSKSSISKSTRPNRRSNSSSSKRSTSPARKRKRRSPDPSGSTQCTSPQRAVRMHKNKKKCSTVLRDSPEDELVHHSRSPTKSWRRRSTELHQKSEVVKRSPVSIEVPVVRKRYTPDRNNTRQSVETGSLVGRSDHEPLSPKKSTKTETRKTSGSPVDTVRPEKPKEQMSFGGKKFQRFEVKSSKLASSSSKPIRINLKPRPARQPIDDSVLEINASPESSIGSSSPERDANLDVRKTSKKEASPAKPAKDVDSKVIFTPKDLNIDNIFSLVHKSRDQEKIVVGCVNDKMVKPKAKTEYDMKLAYVVPNDKFKSSTNNGYEDHDVQSHPASSSSPQSEPVTHGNDDFFSYSNYPQQEPERIYRDRVPENYRPSRDSFAYDNVFVKEQNISELDINGEEIIRIERPAEDKPLEISAKAEEMIRKMGWSPGQGLGKNKQGRKAPIQVVASKPGYVGLGFSSR